MTIKRNLLVVSPRGAGVDQLLDYILLNHGAAIVTVRRPEDGREVTLSIVVDEQDPAAHTTLDQWNIH